MGLWRVSPAASVPLLLWAVAEAAEFKHLDGVHRIGKKAEVTERAVLDKRQDENNGLCGTKMKLCPSSLEGGCCPDNYDCGVSSCYATTRGPSTCGTRVGYHACAAIYGGGCCPDGYICETADACVPPSGSAYTFGCPSSHYLCPSSLSYGCCPDGMGCAVNQCYSTEAVTVVETMTITTTEDGERTTYTTRSTSVSEPDIPTDLPEVDSGEEDEQFRLKYFPSAIPKESPTASPDDDDGGGSGLSSGTLAGIVAGAVAFLILVIVAAFIIIRHLNKVVAAVGHSDQSGTSSSRTRPAMKQFRPTDSEIDGLSVDPLMMSPRPSAVRMGSSTLDGASSSDVTPSSFAGAYQAVSTVQSNSRHQSWDSVGQVSSYFDTVPGKQARFSVQSAVQNPSRVSGDSSGTYMHVRHWSNASEESHDGHNHSDPSLHNPIAPAPPVLLTELEAKSVVPELPGSPTDTNVGSPTEDYRRRSGSGPSISNVLSSSGTAHQRMRSGTAKGGDLDVVTEEMHGFHGPTDRMAGKTERPGSRGSWKAGDDQ